MEPATTSQDLPLREAPCASLTVSTPPGEATTLDGLYCRGRANYEHCGLMASRLDCIWISLRVVRDFKMQENLRINTNIILKYV